MQVVLYDLIVSYAKDPLKANGRGTVVVPSMDTFTVTWIIEPIRIGEIPLKVSAKVKDGQAADTIVKNLLVKPNGIAKEISNRQWLTQYNRADSAQIRNHRGLNLRVQPPSANYLLANKS